MDWKGELPSGKWAFFVTLNSQGRPGLFEQFETLHSDTERLWLQVMRQFPQIEGKDFNVNGQRLHALVTVGHPQAETAARQLQDAITQFLELTQKNWEQFRSSRTQKLPQELWDSKREIRAIKNATEFDNLSEFIVQKMLGGDLLSNEDDDPFQDDY